MDRMEFSGTFGESQLKYVNNLGALLGIYSVSGSETEILQYLDGIMGEMGFLMKYDKVGNLYGFRRGNRKDLPKLTFSAHVDTVFYDREKYEVIYGEGGIIRSNGTTILGADDKGGIAAILTILEEMKEYGDMWVVYTIKEEPGEWGCHYGSRNFDMGIIKGTDLVICADVPYRHGDEFGKVIVGTHDNCGVDLGKMIEKVDNSVEILPRSVGWLGGDACEFWRNGYLVIDFMSGSKNLHSVDECLSVVDMGKSVELMKKVIGRVSDILPRLKPWGS